MCGEHDEIPLRGGRVSQGLVRIGDTVRCPRTVNSTFVRRLLHHLTTALARPLTSVSMSKGAMFGDVPADLVLHGGCRAAALIRRFHDLSAALVATPAAGIEVVCHNDLSPCNFVFRDGVPAALIPRRRVRAPTTSAMQPGCGSISARPRSPRLSSSGG